MLTFQSCHLAATGSACLMKATTTAMKAARRLEVIA